MDIYEGHVTALLGHNGAGKTTLIAMMTGMVPATDGNATIYGKDITDPIQMQEIRKLIGKLNWLSCHFTSINCRVCVIDSILTLFTFLFR